MSTDDERLRAEHSEPGRLDIAISGRLDEALGRQLCDILRKQVNMGDSVLIDLRGLDSYEILGREQLQAAHRIITDKKARSAYVAEQTLIRGAALMAIREAGDDRSRPVKSLEQAEQWLTSGPSLPNPVRPLFATGTPGDNEPS